MPAKLLSARFWVVLMVIAATAAGVLVGREMPSEWWVIVGVVVRDYFGRADRQHGTETT